MNKRLFALLLTFILLLALMPATALASHETYVDCYDPACPGYCYIYDQPSSMYGNNRGRMNNGTSVTVYSRDGGWCYVSGYTTAGRYVYGYVHYYSLDDPGPDSGDTGGSGGSGGSGGYSGYSSYISCSHSACPGYCYVYDKPSSMNGNNLGRMNNGTSVTIYSREGSWLYISGYTTAGRYVYGYVHDYSVA